MRLLFAYSMREGLERVRDRIRLMLALFGTALLMIVFGFGISADVNNLSFAVLDRDQTPESRAYLSELRGSPYFLEKPPLTDYADLDRRLKNGSISASIEIPPNFGLDIKRGRPAYVSAWIDGAMPYRASTIRGYLQGMHQLYLSDPVLNTTQAASPLPANIEVRFKYNQDFDSIYAMVPSTLAMLLALFPAILMALAVVREKELGSITNLYVTPVTRLEFLVGKQLPYVAVALINFIIMFAMAIFIFDVPLKGSFLALLAGTIIYVFTTTGKTAVSGWSKCKRILDRETGINEAWRLHDIRRTVATGMESLGVHLQVTEAILGHVAGSKAGVVGIYQRHKYEREKRDALSKWSEHVLKLVAA